MLLEYGTVDGAYEREMEVTEELKMEEQMK